MKIAALVFPNIEAALSACEEQYLPEAEVYDEGKDKGWLMSDEAFEEEKNRVYTRIGA